MEKEMSESEKIIYFLKKYLEKKKKLSIKDCYFITKELSDDYLDEVYSEGAEDEEVEDEEVEEEFDLEEDEPSGMKQQEPPRPSYTKPRIEVKNLKQVDKSVKDI